MQAIAKTVGLLSLAATIVPPALFMFKVLPLEPVKWIMLAATIGWFVCAPLWMKAGDH
jgi:hypothetical protein